MVSGCLSEGISTLQYYFCHKGGHIKNNKPGNVFFSLGYMLFPKRSFATLPTSIAHIFIYCTDQVGVTSDVPDLHS